MRRVLRYDGLLPMKMGGQPLGAFSHDDLREMVGYIRANREKETPFDVVVEGATPGDDPARAQQIVAEWAQAGATWWIESNWEAPSLEPILERIRQGPPRPG
jgi:hypothetical protein